MSKPKTIGYSHTYPITTNGQFQKIWIELSLDEGDDPRQELYKAKKIVNDFFYESNKAAEKQQEQKKESGSEQKTLSREQQLVESIKSCTDLKVLKIYETTSKKYPESEIAYQEKLLELSK